MGLDDLLDDTEEEQAKQEVEELADELNIEDKEELEAQAERLKDAYDMLIKMDKRLREMEQEMVLMRRALIEVLGDDDSDETAWEKYDDE